MDPSFYYEDLLPDWKLKASPPHHRPAPLASSELASRADSEEKVEDLIPDWKLKATPQNFLAAHRLSRQPVTTAKVEKQDLQRRAPRCPVKEEPAESKESVPGISQNSEDDLPDWKRPPWRQPAERPRSRSPRAPTRVKESKDSPGSGSEALVNAKVEHQEELQEEQEAVLDDVYWMEPDEEGDEDQCQT
mmetsp:Transcript_1605/g.3146  ORF Transcript_1605/g.3146 Transcript_1605/m.3146 type:complete len:190 (+) Transcript_1605:52-621(+)